MTKEQLLKMLGIVSGAGLTITLFLLEITDLKMADLYMWLIMFGAIYVFVCVFFVVSYYKNREQVKKLQDEYIEMLRPKKPIRFVASDEELLKTYDEAVLTNDPQKLLKVIAVKGKLKPETPTNSQIKTQKNETVSTTPPPKVEDNELQM